MASSYRRVSARALFIGGLVTGISGISAGTALAATTSSPVNGVVTITTDGAVTVTCESESGMLLVNGADVDSGFTFCSQTRSIRVIGDAAVNTIDLSGVSAVDMMNGASTDVQGNDGADVITGSDMPDHISGGVGADVINAGAGNDVLTGGSGDDLLRADSGNDTLWGSGGAAHLYAGSGDDRLDAGDDFGTDLVVESAGSTPA